MSLTNAPCVLQHCFVESMPPRKIWLGELNPGSESSLDKIHQTESPTESTPDKMLPDKIPPSKKSLETC